MELLLVELTPDQIEKARAVNGKRKQITHALLCGQYGQIFGTEKQCRKRFSAWKQLYSGLFDGAREVKGQEPPSYESTFDLVNMLIEANDALGKGAANSTSTKVSGKSGTTKPDKKKKPKSFLKKLFGG